MGVTLADNEATSVLVVDDDPSMCDILRDVLRDAGYRVEVARRGTLALEALRRLRPDVTLLDVRLPELSGTELLARMRDDGIDTSVILMTAHVDGQSAASAVTHRVFGYLQKPFDLEVLLATVTNAVARRRLESENRRMLADLQARERELARAAAIATARAAELDAMNAVAEAANRSLDRKEMLATTLQAVARVLEGAAEVLLLDEPHGLLRSEAHEVGPHAPALAPLAREVRLGEGVAGAVALSLEPTFLSDVTGDPRALGPELRAGGWRAFGCVPLLAKGRLLGVLGVWRTSAFDPPTQALLPRLAAVLAVSLENAQLFERAQHAVESLRQSQGRLLENERLAVVGQLTAGLAHEINTPCAFILANLHVLRMHLAAVDQFSRRVHAGEAPAEVSDELRLSSALSEAGQIVDECVTGGERIRRIVRDLRTFGRGAREALQPTDLNELLESILGMMRADLYRRAKVTRRLEPIPPVLGHPGRLSQVLVHVLMNAVQALPEDDPARQLIELTTCVEGEWAVVRVRDTGSGIPPEVLPRIFDPYFTTKPVGQGSGLGLAISQDIVRHHGGDIRIDSRVGDGTVVELRFPLPPRPAQEEPLPAPAERKRILVVDDEPHVLRAFSRLVGRQHEVVTCHGGRAAIELLESDPRFDVVLCDLSMPEVSGVEVFERIRERHPQLLPRFGVLTGGAFNDQLQGFLERERPRVLDKPFGVDDVRRFLAAT